MGFMEQRVAKTNERIMAAARDHLGSDEEVEAALVGTTRLPWLLLLVPIFVIGALLEFTGRGHLSAWATGAYVGIVAVFVMRFFYVLLTNRRLLVLKLRPLSNRKVDKAISAPPGAVAAEVERKMINLRLRLRGPGLDEDLQVARLFATTAEEIAQRMRGPTAG